MVAKRGKVYAVGRNVNSHRPTVQHRMVDFSATVSECGQDLRHISLSYTNQPIDSILCLKAGCRAA